MNTGFLHGHVGIVVLFLLLFGYKTFLLLTGKTAQLEVLRNKTKVVEMILGTLILVTGGYLVSIQPTVEPWLITKIALVMAGIPLGIIGLKKGNKALALVAFILFILSYGLAEMKGFGPKKAAVATTGEAIVDGKVLFETECVRCHGEDGKLQAAGAADLSVTKLSKEEITLIIKNGKGVMPAFSQYSDIQIAAIADYLATLK